MATKFEKNYIGTGKKHKEFDIVNVSIKMEDAEKFITEGKDGKKYLNFELTQRKETGKFGETHAAYISVKTESEE
jgi:hypothetical protein